MIITRTPFRVSFFGGGTDYPSWCLKNGGQVLSTAIDKYCYISVRCLPPFFRHRTRVVYSKIELVDSIDQIVHPAVRETLRFLEMDLGLEIHHDGDLPARSGMGSSSSFTVGLLHALYALRGIMPSRARLVRESIHIEQEMIRETVGSQDQAAAAHGGLNHILFHVGGGMEVRPLIISQARRQELEDHLMLFFTGRQRHAPDVAGTYAGGLANQRERMEAMGEMVNCGMDILTRNRPVDEFGDLLHQAWVWKRGLSDRVSNDQVDELYQKARKAGALGGKLTGAGGGGFLLLFAPPQKQEAVRRVLDGVLHVPFRFERLGSQVIFHEPEAEEYALCKDGLQKE